MARRLLLADDSITIQKVVELVLSEEDFEIKSVNNGEDALNLIDTFKPDVVLADIEMPKINGYKLCEKIKQSPSTARVPVILLAGAFEPIDATLAREVGADDSVIKPFESHELISKINASLALSSAEVQEEPQEEELTVTADAEEEVLEIGEEAEVPVETVAEAASAAEVVEETVGGLVSEEDLWSMEEMPEMPEVSEEGVSAEPEVSVEETAAEEHVTGAAVAGEAEPEIVAPEAVVQREVQREPVSPAMAMPSNEELLKSFEKILDEKVSEFLSGLDLNESVLSSMMPSLKESIEKVLWEIAPELVEKMLKEILKSSIASLTAEVEKVIWETVPDLAHTIITREIEKIKSSI
jgi:DNA-binding response OmpR family regulator